MKRAGLVLVILFTAKIALAADATQSPFSLGAGARDLALGGATVAEPRPITAPFWNPAGLVRAERVGVGMFYSKLFDTGMGYQYFGATYPTLDLGTFGIGLFRLGITGIDRRDETNLDLGEFSDNRFAVYLAYGHELSKFDVGFSLTLNHHSLDTYSSTSSPGVSLSVRRTLNPGWRWLTSAAASLNWRNAVKPSLKLASEKVAEPQTIDAGIALRVRPGLKWDQTISAFFDISKTEGVNSHSGGGLEWNLANLLHLRAGLRDGNMSLGLGIEVKAISFDYAYLERDLGGLHTFSLSAEFGLPRSKRLEIREKQREAQFNRLLRQRLVEYNQRKVTSLVERGKTLIEHGDYDDASLVLDRALFLAAGSDLDTSYVHELATQARQLMETQRHRLAYVAYMDSALARLDTGDFFGVRYFAELALGEDPESEDAHNLILTATNALRQSLHQRQILRQVLIADSLLTYGKYEEALVAARSVAAVAGPDQRIKLIIKRAEFGRFRDMAENALTTGNYHLARSRLDSACVRLSQHPWCKSFASRLAEAQDRIAESEPKPVSPESTPQLTGETLRQVEKTYEAAKHLFEQGNLRTAISKWESVERMAPGYKSVREYLVNGYKFLGVQLYTDGHLEQAIGIWQKAARLAPESAEIANFIKRTQAEIARLEELADESR